VSAGLLPGEQNAICETLSPKVFGDRIDGASVLAGDRGWVKVLLEFLKVIFHFSRISGMGQTLIYYQSEGKKKGGTGGVRLGGRRDQS